MTEFEKFSNSPTPVTLRRDNVVGYRWIPHDEGEVETLIFGAFWHANKVYFTGSNNRIILSSCPERDKAFLNGKLYYTRSAHKEYFGEIYFIAEEKPKSIRIGNKRITRKTRK